MKNHRSKLLLTIAVLTVSVSLAACGQSRSSAASDTAAYYAADSAAENGEYGYEGGAEISSETAGTSDENSEITGDKIVYTGSLTVETLSYEDTVSSITEQIRSLNGIIQSQNEYDGDTSWYTGSSVRNSNRCMYITARIPTDSFDTFMNTAGDSGKVTSRSSSTENISKKYHDNDIEIESLETQEKRLLEMLDQAETVEDMVTIDSRLSEVQTELNQKRSDKSSMDTDVAYSTVTIEIDEVQRYSPDQSGPDTSDFTYRLKEALSGTWQNFVYALQMILIAAIYILPFALLIFALYQIVRMISKKTGKHLTFRKKKDQAPENH